MIGPMFDPPTHNEPMTNKCDKVGMESVSDKFCHFKVFCLLNPSQLFSSIMSIFFCTGGSYILVKSKFIFWKHWAAVILFVIFNDFRVKNMKYTLWLAKWIPDFAAQEMGIFKHN